MTPAFSTRSYYNVVWMRSEMIFVKFVSHFKRLTIQMGTLVNELKRQSESVIETMIVVTVNVRNLVLIHDVLRVKSPS